VRVLHRERVDEHQVVRGVGEAGQDLETHPVDQP
jgi:hypothetical protein